MSAAAYPSGAPRSIDIIVGNEVIEFELDQLAADEDSVESLLEALSDSNAKIEQWTLCVLELVRIGKFAQAEAMANKGVEVKRAAGDQAATVPLLLVLANMRLAKARTAPQRVLQSAQYDILPQSTQTKSAFYDEASSNFRLAQDTGLRFGSEGFLTLGVLQLAKGDGEDSLKQFEMVLKNEPRNIVALMGKGRILYTQKNPLRALECFQMVLRFAPNSQPDPRIGIGLCYWMLNSRDRALTAWRRSQELNPSCWPAELLLGLEQLNFSKDVKQPPSSRPPAAIKGLTHLAASFRGSSSNSAAAAIALSTSHALERGQYERAAKLAEHAMQFGDTRAHLVGGRVALARVYHAQGKIVEAQNMFDAAVKDSAQTNLVAFVGLGQTQIENGQLLEAKHTFETISKRWPLEPEVSAIFASLLAQPNAGLNPEEAAAERARARDLFTRVQTLIDTPPPAGMPATFRPARDVGDDMEMFVEMAKVWHGESLEKSAKAYQSASRVRKEAVTAEGTNGQEKATSSPQLVNNLAALAQLDGELTMAEKLYQEALTSSKEMGEGEEVTAIQTTLLYNLGRAYEGQGKYDEAKEAYQQILTMHPEYSDAKARLAAMALSASKIDEAHSLLKEALYANSSNLDLRAFYLFFLIQTSSLNSRAALDFAFTTLQNYKIDVYSLCAAAWLSYRAGREAKPGPKEESKPEAMKAFLQDRTKSYMRAAEYYDKALSLDPECSFAAQGFAIAIAEDALTVPGSAAAASRDEARTRVANARQALSVFQRVRETISDGSVYINMGHCYYANDEFERAIESYETALQRYYDGVHVPTILYLARTWHTKAGKEGNYSAMQRALRYAKKALELQPKDKAILFNVAMIQQKAAEMLTALDVQKRTLGELEEALEQASEAQTIFQELSTATAKGLPYSVELAEQRFKYGISIHRKGPEQLEKQRLHESTAQAAVDEARKRREEEKQKLANLEQARMDQLREQAAVLATERRAKAEEVKNWVISDIAPEKTSSSSGPRGPKRKKTSKSQTLEDGTILSDEGERSGEEPEARMSSDEDEDGENGDRGEEGAGGGRRKKRASKKRAKKDKPAPRKKKRFADPDAEDAAGGEDNDDDGDEAKSAPVKRGKKVISKEVISDSEDE